MRPWTQDCSRWQFLATKTAHSWGHLWAPCTEHCAEKRAHVTIYNNSGTHVSPLFPGF